MSPNEEAGVSPSETAALLKSVRIAANWAIGSGVLTGAAQLYMLTMPPMFDPALVVAVAALTLGSAYLGYRVRQSEKGRVRRLKVLVGGCIALFLLCFAPSSDGSIGHPYQGFLFAQLWIFGSGLMAAIRLRDREDKVASSPEADGGAPPSEPPTPRVSLVERRGLNRASASGRPPSVRETNVPALGTNRPPRRVNGSWSLGSLRRLLSWKAVAGLVATVGALWAIFYLVDYRARSHPAGEPELFLTRAVPDDVGACIGCSTRDLISAYGSASDVYRTDTVQAIEFSSFNAWESVQYLTDFYIRNDRVYGFTQLTSVRDLEGVELEQNRLVEYWYDQVDILEDRYGRADSAFVGDSLWYSLWRDDSDLITKSKYGDFLELRYESVQRIIYNGVGYDDAVDDITVDVNEKILSMGYTRRWYPRHN